MIAVSVVAHHLIAFKVQGCHPEELVPRTSTKKPHGLRCAGDKLQMSKEEEVRLFGTFLIDAKLTR
jgi:hypothetical protein